MLWVGTGLGVVLVLQDEGDGPAQRRSLTAKTRPEKGSAHSLAAATPFKVQLNQGQVDRTVCRCQRISINDA